MSLLNLFESFDEATTDETMLQSNISIVANQVVPIQGHTVETSTPACSVTQVVPPGKHNSKL